MKGDTGNVLDGRSEREVDHDGDGAGACDDVLGRSDEKSGLTRESIAPALCGALRAATHTATVTGSGRSTEELIHTASLTVRGSSMSMPSMFWCGGAPANDGEAAFPLDGSASPV